MFTIFLELIAWGHLGVRCYIVSVKTHFSDIKVLHCLQDSYDDSKDGTPENAGPIINFRVASFLALKKS